MTRRTLVTGWFSFSGLGATAGDLLAMEVACSWLADAGMAFDVALEPVLGSPPAGASVDWRQVDPGAYSHLLFVCGPFYAGRRLLRVLPRWGVEGLVGAGPTLRRVGLRRIDRIVLELLIRRFERCRQIGLDVSMLGAPGTDHPFATLLQRDGATGPTRADIALAAEGPRVPVVGLVLVEHQAEYAGAGRHAEVDRAIEVLLQGRHVARVRIDTRLDPPNAGGLRSAAEVESLIARMDVVLTTRMHGAVLALKHGVPAVVVDPVAGGAKVTRQMSVLGWPHVVAADSLGGDALGRTLDACLEPDARIQARAAGRRGVALARSVKDELLAALDDDVPLERRPRA